MERMLSQRLQQNVSAWAEQQVQNAKQKAQRAVNFIRTASMSLVSDDDYEEGGVERKQAERYKKLI